MAIVLSQAVLSKLQDKHNVAEFEVRQCFENICGGLLIDDREDHRTNPPTLWFIAMTNKRRLLKVCYVQIGADQHVKSTFEPIEIELRIYRAKAEPKPTDF
jgi:hypothetical protein